MRQGTTFDEILHDMDANFLYELICVAHYLQLKSLIDLTHEAMVKKIENLSSIKELYHMLHRPENVSEVVLFVIGAYFIHYFF